MHEQRKGTGNPKSEGGQVRSSRDSQMGKAPVGEVDLTARLDAPTMSRYTLSQIN